MRSTVDGETKNRCQQQYDVYRDWEALFRYKYHLRCTGVAKVGKGKFQNRCALATRTYVHSKYVVEMDITVIYGDGRK